VTSGSVDFVTTVKHTIPAVTEQRARGVVAALGRQMYQKRGGGFVCGDHGGDFGRAAALGRRLADNLGKLGRSSLLVARRTKELLEVAGAITRRRNSPPTLLLAPVVQALSRLGAFEKQLHI